MRRRSTRRRNASLTSAVVCSGVVVALAAHLVPGQPTELLMDDGYQLVERGPIPGAPGKQQLESRVHATRLARGWRPAIDISGVYTSILARDLAAILFFGLRLTAAVHAF